ncbi:hypothetical protein T310_2353 [Rasamsonia emersonii CBS 393.64]|uniref:Uncharacterized protein n=1 Tax=Rasamsonia emersonii (strain ATCC 16479 / CBS 393.64 / IMI 116815) TaxID=1408163 RepID=A0A0F4YZ84_RASE3|nr:hypothetical protein T310_2353 [Rasamsonia emersonii CBS 393.64]KKA23607.1 hypothetical protein T310_2353 [Rasamsonia emersonii CBS 393.64]
MALGSILNDSRTGSGVTELTVLSRGCVTPRIIANINETLGEDKDYSLLDGFDELPEEEKAKVRRALEQGHVDDTDWRGDIELNRPGKTGFRLKGSKKEATEDAADEAEEEKTKAKKRSRGEDDGEESEDVPAKKAKKEKAAAAKDDTSSEAKPAKRGRPRKNPEAAVAKAEKETEDAPKKAGRGRKKKVVEGENGDATAEANGADDAESKPAKRGRKPAASKEQGETEAAPEKRKRGRPKKQTTTSDE